jgi:hypothetical protein
MKELILKFPNGIEVDFENSHLAQGLIQLKLSGSKPTKIGDCDISHRLYCGVRNYFGWETGDVPISELSKISFNEFHKIRNVGRTTSIELVKFCSDHGITLQP